MYPFCCVMSLKRIESTCCHALYISLCCFFFSCLEIHLSTILLFAICTFPVLHLVPPPPPKSIIIVFSFSWGNCNTQEKLTTKFMQTFFFWGGGVEKVGVLGEMWKLMSNNVISFLLATISVMAAAMLQISWVLLHCICEVVILRVFYLLQARVTLRRTLRDMARELSLSTGSLPSSTSDSLSTKSDQSHSLSSLSINGGKFSVVFCTLEYCPQTG